jgi:hypothetical protein
MLKAARRYRPKYSLYHSRREPIAPLTALARPAICAEFARAISLRDNGGARPANMAIPRNLFKLLSEFIVLLLGALLILLSVSGRIGLPGRPVALIALGVVFVYWGARAGMRPDAQTSRLETRIRAGSLALVGISVLAIPFLSVRYAPLLLSTAGSVLVLRGLLGAVFSFRNS